ncbi:MAG: DUF2155 domain-containing protein [Desulfuromonadaceae bacterium]|nr:DUF2155 domain-containing protein [Desulfuromonadaceae bacterium]
MNVGHGHAETLPNNLKLRPSHLTSIHEKQIIVPHEVLLRWKAIKLAVIDKTRGTENIYSIPIGSRLTIPSSALTIILDAFLPAFTIEGTTITTTSNELINPSAKLRIYENGTPVFEGWLFLKFPNTRAVIHPKFGFSMVGVIPFNR